MPASVYECMFLLDQTKVAGDVPGAAKQLHTLIERNQGEILASRPWDERRLAYPIKGHKKGLYYLTYFRSEGKQVATMEHDFTLSEMVLRYMVTNVDPKLVDIMLAIARDEHAQALQSMHDTPGEGDAPAGGPGEGGEGDGRGRRGPRRHEEDKD